jgi:predicted acyl esterase
LQPAALKAVMPEVTWADPLNGFMYRGGAFCLARMANYYLSLGLNVLARRYRDDPTAREEKTRALCRDIDDLGPVGYRSLPLARFAPSAATRSARYFSTSSPLRSIAIIAPGNR